MKSQQQKTILLCVAGVTPQIITETLWALMQDQGDRREFVDEIRVITTLAGRDRIMKQLLDLQHGQFYAFCRDYGLDPARIRFNESTISLLSTADGRTLSDIRTPEDNAEAADQIAEIVRHLCADPTSRLHASVAGGRKTMSVYLAAAMQLFGRTEDRLSHVLVSEEFESHPDFFYIPPRPRKLKIKDREGKVTGHLSTSQASIHLAEIPFIRLRSVLSEWLRDGRRRYGDLVRRAQEDLDLLDAGHDLRLDARRKTVTMASRHAVLKEREFFIYAMFAELRREGRGEEGFVTPDEITRSDIERLFRRLTAARGAEQTLDDYDTSRLNFAPTMADQVASGNPTDREHFRTTLTEVISKIKRTLEDAEFPERCLIARRGERGALRYGLSVAPERIHFS